MAKLIRSKRRRLRREFVPQFCAFCQQSLTLDYKNETALRNFLSGRGRILGRTKTGICAKHQRQLARAIKRARHLALLPFVANVGQASREQSLGD